MQISDTFRPPSNGPKVDGGLPLSHSMHVAFMLFRPILDLKFRPKRRLGKPNVVTRMKIASVSTPISKQLAKCENINSSHPYRISCPSASVT